MHDPALFKRRHFEAEIILCAVRWYLRYALSDRDIEELLRECGVGGDHSTIFHWVQGYAPELVELSLTSCHTPNNHTFQKQRVCIGYNHCL